jgi:hypothetical protein
MPDKRRHRGPHPQDAELFAADQLPKLRHAVRDFSWLLSRGYPEQGALKLVGDRYRLRKRQRLAVRRGSCSRQAAETRRRKLLAPAALGSAEVAVDGFNLLITIESALSGGFLFEGVDSCYRDLASIHGSYKRVAETSAAIRLAGNCLAGLGVQRVHWLLDKPVSNSGKLLQLLYEAAAEAGWDWDVALHYNPDQLLIESEYPVLTSDSLILDQCARWFNAARFVIDTRLPQSKVIRMR